MTDRRIAALAVGLTVALGGAAACGTDPSVPPGRTLGQVSPSPMTTMPASADPGATPDPAPAHVEDRERDEMWRPQLHYTPLRNWMNDPNGPVVVGSTRHLFYQYNPTGIDWGSIGWGHATSPDLVRWTEQPMAIPAREDGTLIFSGSAVGDPDDTSGLCRGEPGCLAAVYTAHRVDPESQLPVQAQELAISTDEGLTWAAAPGNPVLDEARADFRDPNVFWHAASERWVMPVALPVERRVALYVSRDLQDWEPVGSFGPAGSTDGIWECPALFELPVEGTADRRWVLKVDVNPGHPAGGSGGQYWVGSFDGRTFTPETGPRWVDDGWDHYCALQFSDDPDSASGRTWIAWMSNWAYASSVPTFPWRGAMALPRRLALVPGEAGPVLSQRPVDAFAQLRGEPVRVSDASLAVASDALRSLSTRSDDVLLDLEAVLPAGPQEIRLVVRAGASERTVITWRPADGTLALDRSAAGVPLGADVPPVAIARVPSDLASLDLRVVVDRSSVELFAHGGRIAMTALVLPAPTSREAWLESDGEVPAGIDLTAWPLESIWP